MVIFDTSVGTWEKQKLPSSRCIYGHSSLIVGSNAFVFGGAGPSSISNDLDVFNLKALEIMRIPVFGEKPSPRYHQAAILYGTRIFSFGGQNVEPLADVWILEFGAFAYLPTVV